MRKIFIILLSIFAGLILVSSIVLLIFTMNFELNNHKNKIEKILTQSTGMTFKIKGDLAHDSTSIRVGSINVFDQNGILIELDSVSVSWEFDFSNEIISISAIQLYQPKYHFHPAGIIPFEKEETAHSPSWLSFNIKGFNIVRVDVQNGEFILYDYEGETILDVAEVQSSDVSLGMTDFTQGFKNFFLNGSCNSSMLEFLKMDFENVSTNVKIENAVLNFNSRFNDSPNDDLDLSIDLNPNDILYHTKGHLNDKDFNILKPDSIESLDYIEGYFSTFFNLSFTLNDTGISLKNTNGAIKLSSDSTLLRGVDLDRMVKSFRRTQHFNFKDLGSVMVFGVFGLALSKGTDYADLAFISEKSTSLVEYAHCELKINKGVVDFEDVAFRTKKNRIALDGKINLIDYNYEDFSYALLDKNGCAEIRQVFNGPFENQNTDKIRPITLFLGPVTNLFKETSSILINNDCDHLYQGVVEIPEQKRFLGIKLN